MSKVKMTSREGLIQEFDLEQASRMCRIMKAMRSWPWKLPDTHEFIDGNVRRKSDKRESRKEAK